MNGTGENECQFLAPHGKGWQGGQPMTKTRSETKQEVMSKIRSALAQYGRAYDFALLLAEYPDVPKTTFYRWVRQIEGTGAPAAQAIAEAREAVRQDAVELGSESAVVARDLQSIAETMPVVATAGDFSGLNIGEIARRLHSCLMTAATLKNHATGEDGKIRNPKLYLQASEHERRTLDTASRLADQIYDRNQLDQLFEAIFSRLRDRDPEVVRLILADLRAINNGWGAIL